MTRTAAATLVIATCALPVALPRAARAEGKCPQVYIVMDRTGSMTEKLKSGMKKWDVAEPGLKKFVTEFESSIRFGFSFFNGSANAGGGMFGATDVSSCAGPQHVFDPDYGRGAAISMAIEWLDPYGSTPTRKAMQAVKSQKAMYDAEYDNYVLLFTDGIPNCPEGGEDPKKTSVEAIAALAADGIKTFVLGFGFSSGGIDPTVLNNMAEAGGVPRVGAPDGAKFYAVDDPMQLQEALDEIAGVAGGKGTVGASCRPKGGGGGGGGGGAGPSGGSDAGAGPGGGQSDAGNGGGSVGPSTGGHNMQPGCMCAVGATDAGAPIGLPAALAVLGAAIAIRRRR